ncbi:hypothetical protein FWH30_02455 [Microgenomates group bacterium]|nr:hypothetical protein [Microgenomates group bacterium]
MEKQIKDFYQQLVQLQDSHSAASPAKTTLTAKIIRSRIRDFQHERLIHLLVTLFFGLLLFLSFIFSSLNDNLIFWILTAIVTILEIFYIKHYFILENTLQKIEAISPDIFYLLKN